MHGALYTRAARVPLQPLPTMASVLLAAVACSANAQVPSTMRHVIAEGLPCKTPFACIGVVATKTPKPTVGEILVKMSSASVNPSDLDTEESLGRLEGTLGVDIAGDVVEVGPGVHGLAVGDRVWGVTKGSYAEFALVGASQTGLVPPGLNMSAAGTIPEVGSTSLQCLYQCGARNGGWKGKNLTVVITSGTGGTGFIAVQLAKALGAGHIITSTTGAANIAFARSLGADQVFDYKVQDIFDEGALKNNSVDIVYDNYGAVGTADKAMPTMREGGTFLLLPGGEHGALSKHPKHGVKQIDFGIMDVLVEKKDIDTLSQLYIAGLWRPYVDPRSPFTLDEVDKAFSLSATGTVVGKIAITP